MSTPLASGWEIRFRLAFLQLQGDAFQDLFAQIMERRDEGFQRVRPWGNQGDRKNDGWSPAHRTLFQSYAPSTLSAAKLEAKLVEDYEGAITHWEKYFDTWVFVHNDIAGLAPSIATKLVELDLQSEHVSVNAWGYPQLREEFAHLHDADRRAVLGPPLTSSDFLDVRATRLRPMIEALGQMVPSPIVEVRPVPEAKIEANDLLPAQVEFLQMGSRSAPLVEHYLTNAYLLPSHADAIAEAVSAQYRQFREEGRLATEIFDFMLSWISGGTAESTVLVHALAILAYFFERCHIFEIPREAST